MKIRYSSTFKLLSAISFIFFVVGILVFFLPQIEAEVIEVREASFGGSGYSGLPHDQFFGSNSGLTFVTYDYKVGAIKYSGWGLAEMYNGRSVLIKYVPFSPSITFSSSAPYLMFCGFFLFLAFGVRSVVVWVTNMLRKNAS